VTCPAPWILSTHADGELARAEAVALDAHALDCATCRDALAALRAERATLRTAFHAELDEAPIPPFAPPPAQSGGWLALALTLVATGALVETFWGSVGAAVPLGLRWLNPFTPSELFERALNLLSFFVYEGTAMWTSTANVLAFGSALLILGTAIFASKRRPAGAALLASVVAIALAPFAGHALETRQGALVTVAAGETIDDTLLAAGETIAIDGDVNGDLLAFGRSITIRGNVVGDLIAGGETITVEGSVGGSIVGGGRAISVLATRVGRNVYGFGRDINLGADANVAGNALAFGTSVEFAGRVGKDLKGFTENLTIRGAVDGDVEGYAGEINLLPSARVGGDVVAHVDSADDLRVAPGATVGGATRAELVEREQRRNRYLTVRYYVGRVIGLAAAFVVGLLLLTVFPTLRELSLPNALAVLRTGGIGLAAAIVLPVVAVLACVTIVGLPLGILIFLVGAAGLYFATPIVAQIVGRMVFTGPEGAPHYAATLAAGLVIVTVATSLPLVGGLASFVVAVVGFGLIVSLLIAHVSRNA
jgi:anti-sigma factor RsiW